jgi:phosphatidate phosphatase
MIRYTIFRMEPVHFIKIGSDILILLVTIAAWILVHFVLPIRKSGFKCDDYSISLPYLDSTVTNLMLILICTVIPTIVICGTELTRKYYPAVRHRNKYVYKIKMLKNSLINIPEILGNIYINLGSYMFGLLVVQFLTNLAKYTIGRLRPHYIDVCKPLFTVYNLTRIDCKLKEYFAYEVDYICTNVNTNRFHDAHLSFPSGHASTSVYTMIFLILYIKYTWKCRRMGLVTPFVQTILFSVAFFTCLTRVVDHKHHFTDVLAGSVIGFVFSIMAFIFLTDFVKRKTFSSSPDVSTANGAGYVRSNSKGFASSNKALATAFIENP